MRATRTAAAQSAPETGEELLARILTERRNNWHGRGRYEEPGPPEDASLPSLPNGWIWTRLEQLGFMFGGLTKNPKRAKLPKQLPYLRVANVYANELRLREIEHIGVEDSELPKLLVRAGDLLIVEGNGSKDQIGRLAIWDGSIAPCVHQNHLIKVRPVHSGMPKWILHWLQSPSGRHFVELVASSTSGLYTLSVNKVGDLPIPLAPPPDQQRIVAEIEKQFTRLEAGVAALRRAQANLKRYRAAVLKAACEGHLVPTEAELAKTGKRKSTFETGEALLARILTDRRKNWKGRGTYREPAAPDIKSLPTVPPGWTWATIEQVSEVVRGASPRPAGDPRYFGGDVPWITVGPLTADNSPYLQSVPTSLNSLGREHSRYVQPQTLLLTNSGATLGVPKITLIGGCINDGVAALLDVPYPLKLYLLYFLRTQTERLRGVNQGAAQPNLNTTIIKSIDVSIPPVSEQTRIVAEVERRLSVVEELEAVVKPTTARPSKNLASGPECWG